MLPQIVIIGRPNVGKSTLFNRLVGKKLALVDDQPGVTRDRRSGMAEIAGLKFELVDTAGWEQDDPASLPGRMRKQTEMSLVDADVALMVIDARQGVTTLDEEIALWLRAQKRPVVMVCNKAEGKVAEAGIFESYALGFGDPVPVSAEHGEGIADLFGALWPLIGDYEKRAEEAALLAKAAKAANTTRTAKASPAQASTAPVAPESATRSPTESKTASATTSEAASADSLPGDSAENEDSIENGGLPENGADCDTSASDAPHDDDPESGVPHGDDPEREEFEDLIEGEEEELTGPLKLAIVGRPNAGKSTLINHLLGEDRLLTGPEAGITRDSIAVDWQWNDPTTGTTRDIRLIDTAGMRKKARVTEKLEKLAVSDARHAVDFSEVVILLLDATQGLEHQDLKIASMVLEEGRALIVAINKWDIAEDASRLFNGIKEALGEGLAQVRGVPLFAVSAKSGKGLNAMLASAFEIRQSWSKRVPTAALNRWFEHAINVNPPPAPKGRRIKLRYITQVGVRPPRFLVFGTRLDSLPTSYERYLINSIRKQLGFEAVPVRITLKSSKNPYAS